MGTHFRPAQQDIQNSPEPIRLLLLPPSGASAPDLEEWVAVLARGACEDHLWMEEDCLGLTSRIWVLRTSCDFHSVRKAKSWF